MAATSVSAQERLTEQYLTYFSRCIGVLNGVASVGGMPQQTASFYGQVLWGEVSSKGQQVNVEQMNAGFNVGRYYGRVSATDQASLESTVLSDQFEPVSA